MLKKAVIWRRSEPGDKEDLARQKQVLFLFSLTATIFLIAKSIG